MHTFHVPLTKDQVRQINDHWLQHGTTGGAMLAQPIFNYGPFHLSKPVLNVAICPPVTASAINRLLDDSKQFPVP